MAEVISVGRRVGSFDEIERAGDYFGPTTEVGQDDEPTGKRGLWFLLPIHSGGSRFGRDSEGDGLHRVTEPPWTFRECDDGSLEVRASILCGRTDENPNGYWHGYLDEGNRWRQL